MNLLLALALELRSSPRRILPMALNLGCALLAIFVASSSLFYDRSLLSLSAVLYGNSFQGLLDLGDVAATNELVFMADGVNDSVAVFRSASTAKWTLPQATPAHNSSSATSARLSTPLPVASSSLALAAG